MFRTQSIQHWNITVLHFDHQSRKHLWTWSIYNHSHTHLDGGRQGAEDQKNPDFCNFLLPDQKTTNPPPFPAYCCGRMWSLRRINGGQKLCSRCYISYWLRMEVQVWQWSRPSEWSSHSDLWGALGLSVSRLQVSEQETCRPGGHHPLFFSSFFSSFAPERWVRMTCPFLTFQPGF